MDEYKKKTGSIAKAVWGRDPDKCKEKGICVACGEEALPKCYSKAGRDEYEITVICEECFDKIFGEDNFDPLSEDFEDYDEPAF